MHLQTERALAAVGFVQHRGTPDVAARLKEYPPYTFLKIQEKKQKVRYAYSSPARRTIFVGDEEALKHYSSYLFVLQQSENIRRIQKQQQWAQTQQALAYGLIAGAAALSQQPVYQPTVYAAPPTQNYPVQTHAGGGYGLSQPSSTTRLRSDGLGGYRSSDGTRIKPDGLGGYRVSDGMNTSRLRSDGLGGYRGSDGTRIKPDGLGGYRVSDGQSTTRFRSDGLGGYRGSDGTRIKPDGLGGYRLTEGF